MFYNLIQILTHFIIVDTFLLQMFVSRPPICDDVGAWSHMILNYFLKNLTGPFTPRTLDKEDFIGFSV